MAVSNSVPTTGDLVAQVEPILRRTAALSEAERRLAPEAMQALIDSGVLRALLPAKYGGFALGAVDGARLIEDIAYVDGAAGWVAFICMAISTIPALFASQFADEIFADPRAVTCGAWFPPGSAEPVQGGYRVTGHWAFGSGSDYATWLTGQVQVTENGAPKLGCDGQPRAMIVFFPAAQAEIVDNWHTLGMRGTGSNDFVVHDIFVPEHQTWHIGPWIPVNPAFSAALYRLGAGYLSTLQACVTLGMARAAIDDLITLAQTKTPSYTTAGLADKPVVQDKVARARAIVDAASSYIQTTIAKAEAMLQMQPKLSMQEGIPLALTAPLGIQASVDAINLVHACTGTSGIRNDQRFQQYFRDIHTLSQHAFSSPSRFESVGKLMLGRESDWPFHYV